MTGPRHRYRKSERRTAPTFPEAPLFERMGLMGPTSTINRLPRVVRAGPPWVYERSPEGTPNLGPPVGACPAPNVAEC